MITSQVLYRVLHNRTTTINELSCYDGYQLYKEYNKRGFLFSDGFILGLDNIRYDTTVNEQCQVI